MKYYEKQRIATKMNLSIQSYYFSSELTQNFTDIANESALVFVSVYNNSVHLHYHFTYYVFRMKKLMYFFLMLTY